MEKDKIIIRLYEILNKENQGMVYFMKTEDSDFHDGIDQGIAVENNFFKKEIKTLIKEIKSNK